MDRGESAWGADGAWWTEDKATENPRIGEMVGEQCHSCA